MKLEKITDQEKVEELIKESMINIELSGSLSVDKFEEFKKQMLSILLPWIDHDMKCCEDYDEYRKRIKLKYGEEVLVYDPKAEEYQSKFYSAPYRPNKNDYENCKLLPLKSILATLPEE